MKFVTNDKTFIHIKDKMMDRKVRTYEIYIGCK